MTFGRKLHVAAAHFGCAKSPDAVRLSCRQRADAVCARLGDDLPPADRLLALADHYSVEFEVASTTRDLDAIIARHAAAGDGGFALRRDRFDENLLACIMRRTRPREAERRFVALIDGRDHKAAMAFFSKSHEVAHPALEPQLKFEFRDEVGKKTQWERFVDQVGADCVFGGAPWHAGLRRFADGVFGISKVDDLRASLVPEASLTAVALAAGNSLGKAVFVVWAELAGSKSDPTPVLRLKSVTPNHIAAQQGYRLHRNFRVPLTSPLSVAFYSEAERAGMECLSTWTSRSATLGALAVQTSGVARGAGAFGIIASVR